MWPAFPETVNELYRFLGQCGVETAMDYDTAQMLTTTPPPVIASPEIFNQYQLMIVVGGDGSLLNAAHLALAYHLPILGINRGRLGFLADIHPHDFRKSE